MAIYYDLFSELNPEDLILTVNHRLAEYLRIQHRLCKTNKLPPISILPIANWLQDCSTTLALASQQELNILQPTQEFFLWQEIIENSSYGQSILYPAQTAYLAQKAWEICKQWKINLNWDAFTHTQDSQAFQTWAHSFTHYCQNNAVIDHNSLADYLALNLAKNKVRLPQRIFLLGFDEINPQYHHLFVHLTQLDCPSINYKTTLRDAEHFQFAANDEEDEIHQMAKWAHKHYSAGRKNIGCIVPNLTAIHQEINSLFTDIFQPESKLNPSRSNNDCFNISVSFKLSQYPLIATALKILQLNNLEDLTTISQIIRSPYIGEAVTELNQRAKLDVKIRAEAEKFIYLPQVMLIAHNEQVMHLYQRLKDYLELVKNNTEQLTHQAWAKRFTDILASLGWPGEAILNDDQEKVIITSWNKLLTTFTTLGNPNTIITQDKAMQQIICLSSSLEIDKQTSTAPVQILGTLEASGIEFDYLWVAQMNDKQWPSVPNPNPFIPFSVQREYKTPHSTTQREFKYCQEITLRLMQSTKYSIFSYAQQNEQQIINASAFIKDFTLLERQHLQLDEHHSIAQQIYTHNLHACEYVVDDYGPAISLEEKITGGAAIFKHQAACPFKAFTHLRLGAKPLEYPTLGLNAKERGILLHQILESVWNEIQTHARLLQYSPIELLEVINNKVSAAILEFNRLKPLTMQPHFVAVEKKRLNKLVLSWLEIEIKRQPFSIQMIEQTQVSKLAGIEFKQRMDRIDKLADDSLLIIDYKTGMVTTNAWLGSRPDDPQLPLYCITNPNEISGIAFAQIRSDKKQFKGLASKELNIPGIDALIEGNKNTLDLNWNELVEQWKQVLVNLAETYKQGYAIIDPKDGLKTCVNCELKLVCRINHNEDIT